MIYKNISTCGAKSISWKCFIRLFCCYSILLIIKYWQKIF